MPNDQEPVQSKNAPLERLFARLIKPSNIMVRLDEGGAATVKIIGFELAKAVNGPDSQTAISTPGSFAGKIRQNGEWLHTLHDNHRRTE
jgi:serine/threonine protein kinase